MDNQKQIIEEMAEILIDASCKGSECEECSFIDSVKEAEGCCVCLKAFYNAGYRKIPENAVVLTREEYERLKGYEPIMIKPPEPLHLAEIKQLNQRASDYAQMMNEMSDDLKKARERIVQTRKETAEKFAERLKELYPDKQTYKNFYWCIDEICKEFTEGKE